MANVQTSELDVDKRFPLLFFASEKYYCKVMRSKKDCHKSSGATFRCLHARGTSVFKHTHTQPFRWRHTRSMFVPAVCKWKYLLKPHNVWKIHNLTPNTPTVSTISHLNAYDAVSDVNVQCAAAQVKQEKRETEREKEGTSFRMNL